MTVAEFIGEWRSAQDYIVAHTSGSTGEPKEIHLPKEMVAASARRTLGFFGLGPESSLHLVLSPDYIAGKMMIVRALECGCRFSWENPSNRPTLEGARRPIDLLAVVPSQMPWFLDNPELMSSVRRFLIGGSAIPGGLCRRIVDSGAECWESYGMTETASHVALRRVTGDAGAPFTMLPGLGRSVGPEGNLIINLEGKSLSTCDAAELTENSGFRLLGRMDNVINSGGIKIHPEQVETALTPLQLECEYYVTSRQHPKWGEETLLVIESEDISPVRKIQLLSEMTRILGHVKAPKDILCLPSLSRTSTGKIRRRRF